MGRLIEECVLINTQGLDEGIRCAMCTNSMANDRGCDGSCVVNEAMYKKVLDTIQHHVIADYENRLKADMVAMLTELQLEINEIPINADNSEPFKLGQASAYDKCENLIQQKINALQADRSKDDENDQ